MIALSELFKLSNLSSLTYKTTMHVCIVCDIVKGYGVNFEKHLPCYCVCLAMSRYCDYMSLSLCHHD